MSWRRALRSSELARCADDRICFALWRGPPTDGSADPSTRRSGCCAAATLFMLMILGHIGSGGMGVVYQAYDPKLDRQIVLKLLRVRTEAPDRSEAARQRLAREAPALAKLTHPNVITVHDVGEVNSSPTPASCGIAVRSSPRSTTRAARSR